MIHPQIVRALLVGLATLPNAFATEPVEVTTVLRTPADLSEVEALRPGGLTQSTCGPEDAPVPCLAIPVSVEGVDEFGQKGTVVATYPVGPELATKVKEDFEDVADVVLRNLRPAIASGTKAKDHATRLACKQSIAQVDRNVKYRLASSVRMPVKIEKTVAQFAKQAAARIKRPIVVTSAARTPESQAEALRTKIAMGDDIVKLYRDKESAYSVLLAYKTAKRSGASKSQVVARMADVIEAQVEKGVFLSNHLREGAVDIRTRDLTRWQRKQLVAAAQEVPGVRKTLMENIPPHLHLEVE